MRNTPKSDISLSFPSLSDIRKITKKCQKIPTYYLQMIQVNGKSYPPMADIYAPEYRLGVNMLLQPASTQCMHCASYPILLLSCLSMSSPCLANYGIMCRSIEVVFWHFLMIFLMSERLGNVKHMSDLGVFRIFRICLIQESRRSKGGSPKIF